MATILQTMSSSRVLTALVLCQDSFSKFGTVIENPNPDLVPSPCLKQLPQNAVQANQGSALKYLDVTSMLDFYNSTPSMTGSKAVMNMFVCAPRALLSIPDSLSSEGLFPVNILERHPFTTQTFIPLGLSPKEQSEARYLVIVAPSLPPSEEDCLLPVPSTLSHGIRLPGRRLPDLTRLQAFLANGAQAVTYGAGTWHAPMVAIGKKPIAFVVAQFANGVELEDCQEVVWDDEANSGIKIAVPRVDNASFTEKSKL
jgi:ureidoglycolate lyase